MSTYQVRWLQMLLLTAKGQAAKVELGDAQSIPRNLTVTYVPGFVIVADNTGISGGVGLKHSVFPAGAVASMEFLV